MPTLMVAVNTIGVSRVPHSRIVNEPVNSPAPFNTAVPAAIGRSYSDGSESGHDRGDSGAVTGDRRVADAYAVDIGDRVVAASAKRSNLDAALAWARPLLGTRLRHPP